SVEQTSSTIGPSSTRSKYANNRNSSFLYSQKLLRFSLLLLPARIGTTIWHILVEQCTVTVIVELTNLTHCLAGRWAAQCNAVTRSIDDRTDDEGYDLVNEIVDVSTNTTEPVMTDVRL